MFDLINFFTRGLLEDTKVREYFTESLISNFQSKLNFFNFLPIFAIFFTYLFLFYKNNKKTKDFGLALLASGFVTIVFYGLQSLIFYFGILLLFGFAYIAVFLIIFLLILITLKAGISVIKEKLLITEEKKKRFEIRKLQFKNLLVKLFQIIIVLLLTIILALIANNLGDSLSKAFETDAYLCRSKMFKDC